MKADTLKILNEARRNKRTVVLVTRLETGVATIARATSQSGGPLGAAVTAAIASGRSSVVDINKTRYFLQVFSPPRRIVIVGAVHAAETLTGFAHSLGYEVIIVDPRNAYTQQERFPDATIMESWPDDAFEEIKPDSRTAIVTLTHDPKIDDPALCAVLRSPVFYIAALGSRKTHAKRVARLQGQGFDESEISRIRSPAGIDIGARTPAEIALSIISEIVITQNR